MHLMEQGCRERAQRGFSASAVSHQFDYDLHGYLSVWANYASPLVELDVTLVSTPCLDLFM